MIRRPPRSTPLYSSAASDVYKRQGEEGRNIHWSCDWASSLWFGEGARGSCLLGGARSRSRRLQRLCGSRDGRGLTEFGGYSCRGESSQGVAGGGRGVGLENIAVVTCLLYTSDAADE